MDESATIAQPYSEAHWLGNIPAFALHTAIVYMCAPRISGTLVGRWFAWIEPIFPVSGATRGEDWYMQHLELVTVVPALIAGYINLARFLPAIVGRPIADTRSDSAVTWAWLIPALVLAYEMIRYHCESSVLVGASVTRFGYFFNIQRVSINWKHLFSSDNVRIAKQMLVTAPFYAGLSYSLGGFLWKRQAVTKLFTFEKVTDD